MGWAGHIGAHFNLENEAMAKHLLTLLTLAALLAAGPVPAADWSQDSLAYRYGTRFREPANPDFIARHSLQWFHAAGNASGQDTLSVTVLRSDGAEPARQAERGASELYLAWRHQWSGTAWRGVPLAAGPLKDVALSVGLDANTKDSAFLPRKRVVVAGPVLRFDVPGLLDVGLLAYKEWNHCGLPPCQGPMAHSTADFDLTWQLAANWALPFRAAGVGWVFQGMLAHMGPKGDDYFGRPTVEETLLRTALMADLGALAVARPGRWLAGLGYEEWHNKTGVAVPVGNRQRAFSLNLEWRL